MDNSSPAATAALPILCKAAVADKPGEKFRFEDIIVAPPRKHQVRIKILHTTVCQTDITFSALQGMDAFFPAIFGHEASGIVESVGEGVTHVQAGDHVLPCSQGQCGTCLSCKDYRSNMCVARPSVLLAPNLQGVEEHHFTKKDGTIINCFLGCSTFSEYTLVYMDNVAKINPQAPLEQACVLSCGVATGLGAAWNICKVKPGSTVAVFGLGTVGLAAVQGCKVAGASRIIGVDINPSKRLQGKLFGITDFINPKDNTKPTPEVISELLGGMGVDYSIECSGNVKALADAVESTQKEWGVTAVVGCPLNIFETAQIRIMSLLYGRMMIGSSVGGLRVRDLPELVEKSVRMEISLDLFTTHNLPFSQLNEAFDLFKSGECLRCVLHMGS